MFDNDALHRRGQALEDEFFHRVDEKLCNQLRQSMAREELKKNLAAATGFENDKLLDHLIDGGIQPTTLAALALVPTVFVAWADGSVTPQERQVVINAALRRGLDHQPTALQLVEHWLHERPPKSLWKLWKEYVEAVHESVTPTLADMLRNEVLRQATAVAEASGGTLGIGKVSKAEQELLKEIAEISAV